VQKQKSHAVSRQQNAAEQETGAVSRGGYLNMLRESFRVLHAHDAIGRCPVTNNPDARSDRWTILIVDNEISIIRVLSEYLRGRGFNIMSAMSGEDALRQVRACAEPIHLLLCDIQMPGMSGIDLCNTLERERPQTEIVLMSGSMPDVDLSDKAWHFLLKPFPLSRLAEEITAAVSGKPQRRLSANKNTGGAGY